MNAEPLTKEELETMENWLDQLKYGGPAQHALLGNPPFPAEEFARRAIATIQGLNTKLGET